MIVSSAFVLALVILCINRPNAGRIFLGFFFLAMALGVNGSFTFGNPQAYLDYAEGALIPLYRDLAVSIVAISPVAFGLVLMTFEIAVGLLLLDKHRSVRLGLIGTTVFLVGIAPLSWLQIPWLGLIVAQVHLFRREFDRSFLEIIRMRNMRENMNNNKATDTIREASLPGKVVRTLAAVLVRILVILVTFLLCLTVIVLPLSTSVPAWAWILLAIADIALIVLQFRLKPAWRGISIGLSGTILVSVLAIIASQLFAATPSIRDAKGKPLPGSIATLEKVNLNGTEQLIKCPTSERPARPRRAFLSYRIDRHAEGVVLDLFVRRQGQ